MLTGAFPFDDESDESIRARILAGEYRLAGPVAPPPTSASVDLIARLLDIDPSSRLTIADAKQHAWFEAHPTNSAVRD